MGNVFVRDCCLCACALTRECECVQYCSAYCVCLRFNWAWMMMAMMMTTMFIACLVKKKKKKVIACVQSMKCDNLFIDSCPVGCVLQSSPALHFTFVGPASVPNIASVRIKHWVVDRCMFNRISVTKCFCVLSLPLRCPFPVWERFLWFLLPHEACFCSSCFTFSMILTLL